MGAGSVRGWLSGTIELGRGKFEEEEGAEAGEGLSPQQREAALRGVQVVETLGGVLLADAVGLGKTNIAIEMVRRLLRRMRRRGAKSEPPLFVVPARLRRQWERAVREVGWQPDRDVKFVSHHFLSRESWSGCPAVVVVDEAHRFRKPGARRSRNLAKLSARAPVILVTASPVCTSIEDLRQLLGYFLTDEASKKLVGLGLQEAFAADEAGELDLVELLEEVVIRRREADFGEQGRPGVRFELLRFETTTEEDWLWRNLEPTLQELSFFAAGAGWPRGLIIHNLLRLWESGAEALGHSLEELIHYHERWLEAAAAGRRIERLDFRQLFGGVHRGQQVFAFLYEEASALPLEAEVEQVRGDLRLLLDIFCRVQAVQGGASTRIRAILGELRAHKDEPYLIFTAYRAAAQAIFREVTGSLPGERVGLVTGEEAVMSGAGSTRAEEVVERFAAPGAVKESLRVLIATDCMSEGVNLQRCSRLILADLPSTPLRLEQRIGRIARPGSKARQVQVYLLRPMRWVDNLGMRRRLEERLEVANMMGLDHELARSVQAGEEDEVSGPGPLSAMTLEERIRGHLRREKGVEEAPEFARLVCEDWVEGEEELWARVVLRRGEVERGRWLWIPGGAKRPVVRLSDQISGLAELADDRRSLESWECGGRAWEIARRWVEERRQLFEAARLAPPLLGCGSAPVGLWRILREGVRAGEVKLASGELETLYQRLLSAHPGGIRLEMEEFLERGPTAGEVRRFVEALPASEGQERTEIFIARALYKSGPPERRP